VNVEIDRAANPTSEFETEIPGHFVSIDPEGFPIIWDTDQHELAIQ